MSSVYLQKKVTNYYNTCNLVIIFFFLLLLLCELLLTISSDTIVIIITIMKKFVPMTLKNYVMCECHQAHLKLPKYS